MNKKLLILLFVSFISAKVFAQLEVKANSFKEVPGFVNIDPDKQTDDNEKPYSVIKVRTENINDKQRRELNFQGDAQTFFEIEYRDGEVWLYISYYATFLKISHPDLSSTEFTIPYDMKPKCGYELTLINKISNTVGLGSLIVKTIPEDGASIMINGRLIAQTTPYTNDMIAAGEYDVTVSKDRYMSVSRHVIVKDGDNQFLDIEMPPLCGSIVVKTNPSNANVIIAGQNRGYTPLTINDLQVGDYELVVEKEGYASITKSFVLNDSIQLVFNEQLSSGREFTISTNGTNDRIFIDGEYVGISPVKLTIAIGKHDVTAVRGSSSTNLASIQESYFVKVFNRPLTVDPKGKSSIKIMFGNGSIDGVFSISSNKKVKFAQGNLQYSKRTNSWRFAKNQWDIASMSKNTGWIDLFGWGTGNAPTKTAKNDSYYRSYYEWGKNNIDNAQGTWRTLTSTEWAYVVAKRRTSSGILFAKANVNGINGVLLLPDNWSIYKYNLNNCNNIKASYKDNIIDLETWYDVFEANGVVFLPAAGDRYGITTKRVNRTGNYWSSVDGNYGNAIVFAFNLKMMEFDYYTSSGGRSVRLVTDAW